RLASDVAGGGWRRGGAGGGAMNPGELLILSAIGVPLFSALVTYAVGRMPDVRETLTLVACIALAIVTISIFVRVGAGSPPEMMIAQPLPGLDIAFRLEPLGALFASQMAFSPAASVVATALVIGLFLHIATTILFEADSNAHHQIAWEKLLAIGLGAGLALWMAA
ncbi:MAG: hypothetical protein ACK4Q5_16835, partial [Saprospiraceae bacterium]